MTKRKWFIGGAELILGICAIILLFTNIYPQLSNEEYVIIETEDEDVPLTDTIPGISTEDLDTQLADRLALVPANILNAMTSDGWVITLTSENLSDRYFKGIYSTVNAVTDSTIKTIWINNTSRAITKSTIHEIGHYLDYKSGIINKSDEFKRIYTAEKDNFSIPGGNASYARSSTQEYFGEAFQECILYPEMMMQNCPQTYSFIMSLAANL